MSTTRLLVALALAGATLPAWADDGTAFNAGVVTEYSYRGLSQSRLKPAVQGGVDYTQGGLYLGAWASSIKWVKDAGGGANIEADLYGGYKGELNKGLGYDVGGLAYFYPGHDLSTSPNTFEIYGALSFGPATLKYSHSLTNLFGFTDSKGSGYLELGATFDVGSGFSLTPHVGYQRVKGWSDASYTDYSLSLSKEVSKVLLSATVAGTDTDLYVSPAGKNLGKARLILGAKLNF